MRVWLLAALATSVLATGPYARPKAPQCSAGAVCGGIAGLRCQDGYYCGYPAGRGHPDETGVCKLKPQVCPMIYKPVCGRDGKTYSNACVAAAHEVSVAAEGACA